MLNITKLWLQYCWFQSRKILRTGYLSLTINTALLLTDEILYLSKDIWYNCSPRVCPSWSVTQLEAGRNKALKRNSKLNITFFPPFYYSYELLNLAQHSFLSQLIAVTSCFYTFVLNRKSHGAIFYFISVFILFIKRTSMLSQLLQVKFYAKIKDISQL